MAKARFVQVGLCLCVLSLPVLGLDPMAPPYARGKASSDEFSQKLQVSKPKQQAYVLRQIVSREEVKSAVINGYIVNEGSYIHNAFVRKINENSVVLNIKGKRKEIILENPLPRIRR